MKWLLFLYPPAWRRRYRHEVEAYLAEEPPLMRTAADLMAGAIDAWLNPKSIPDHPDARAQGMTGDEEMTEAEGFICTAARYGSLAFSRQDAQRSGALMLGVTVALTAVGIALDKTLGDHIMIDALIYSSMFIGIAVAARSTYLRPYSTAARNGIVMLVSVAWYLFFLLVALVGAAT